MKVILNGKERAFDAPVTVADLLSALGLMGQRVAVEINHEIVPKSVHPSRRLAEDDRVEVVCAIGGG
jgi:sulfur carrier protein